MTVERVREADLADALNAGRSAGAGPDVLAVEPPLPDNPLLKAKNCLITPQISWASTVARRRMMDTAVNKLRADGIALDFVGTLEYMAYGKDGGCNKDFDPQHHLLIQTILDNFSGHLIVAAGRLLMLAPFPHQRHRQTITLVNNSSS